MELDKAKLSRTFMLLYVCDERKKERKKKKKKKSKKTF